MVYTYSIITTDANKQLKFLHDRMPVILDNGSDAIRTWLDPHRTEWSRDLQSLLKPYGGELECYPVSKDVGKVGNNSPSFVVPINSAANKSNIANFFGNQRKAAKLKQGDNVTAQTEHDMEDSRTRGIKVEHDIDEVRATSDRLEGTEDNAPLPVPATVSSPPPGETSRGIKRERSDAGDDERGTADGTTAQRRRLSQPGPSPTKGSPAKPAVRATKKTRSATSNGSAAKGSPAKGDGSRKITSFFSK
jgi:hypothetical protein